MREGALASPTFTGWIVLPCGAYVARAGIDDCDVALPLLAVIDDCVHYVGARGTFKPPTVFKLRRLRAARVRHRSDGVTRSSTSRSGASTEGATAST